MNRISQSLIDIKDHVKEKFQCIDCCTILCWTMMWLALYTIITAIMVIMGTCQILLFSETYEIFPRKSTVPYYMFAMILLQIIAILLYTVAISEKSDKIALVVLIYLIVLSVVFVIIAILTQINNTMEEEETLNDAKFLDTMKYHFHNTRYMTFWVRFQKNFECCGVNDYTDWLKQTGTMILSGGCCRPYASSKTMGMEACSKYGLKFVVMKGCSRQLNEAKPFQVTRNSLLAIAILLTLYHIPGIVLAFILKRRFYILYYLDYDDDDFDDY